MLFATTTIDHFTPFRLRNRSRTRSTDSAAAAGSQAASTTPRCGALPSSRLERHSAKAFACAYYFPFGPFPRALTGSSSALPREGLEAKFDLLHRAREVKNLGHPCPTFCAQFTRLVRRLQQTHDRVSHIRGAVGNYSGAGGWHTFGPHTGGHNRQPIRKGLGDLELEAGAPE